MSTPRFKFIIGILFGFILAASLVQFNGCAEDKMPVPNPNTTITTVQGGLKADTKSLQDSTTKIKNTANQGQKITPPAVKPVLDPLWTDILIQTGTQDNIAKDLIIRTGELDGAKAQVDQLTGDLTKATDRATAAELKLKDALTNRLMGLVVIGVLCFAVSVWLMCSGYVLGKALGIASIALIGTSIVLIKVYTFTIPPLALYIGGGAIGLACAGFGIYYYQTHKANTKKLTSANAKLNNEVMDTTKSLAETSLKLTAVSKDKEILTITHNDLVKNFDSMKNQLTVVGEQKMRLEQVQKVSNTADSSRLDTIEQKASALEKKVESIDNRVASVEKTVTGLPEKIQKIDKRSLTAKKTAEVTHAYIQGLSAGRSEPISLLRNQDIWTGRVA